MAHFAQLNDNNIVLQVIVVHNGEMLDENGHESEAKGIEFCKRLLGGKWVQTSYNNKFRKRYAGIGYIYDPGRDVFLFPKPFPSWVLDEVTFEWVAPEPMPNYAETEECRWDEMVKNWVVSPRVFIAPVESAT
jgi:hypothetical protein